MNIKGRAGLYIHWPFCLSKCPYCDFNVHVQARPDHVRWEAAYLKSLESYAQMLEGRVISSVFFGGGTPSLMNPETVQKILSKVRALWPLVNDLEITMEANPTSVEAEKLKAFKEAGVTRVSLGVQALNDTDLKFLGRKHSAADAIGAIEIAADNFEHFSFDLIYARPGQTLEGWREELKRAAALATGGHLSLYQLTIERNTPFYYDAAQGLFNLPDDGQGAAFYHATQEVLDTANLPAYEVSNHAAPGRESRHNLTYWHYGDYIGIGPGAHGRLSVEGQKVATREHYAPQKWLEMVEREGRGVHPFQPLSHEERFCEALMMGLRLYEGVALEHLQAEGGGRDWREYIDAGRIETARGEGWLDIRDGRIVLSREGMLRLNALIPYILKDPSRPAQKERAV